MTSTTLKADSSGVTVCDTDDGSVLSYLATLPALDTTKASPPACTGPDATDGTYQLNAAAVKVLP